METLATGLVGVLYEVQSLLSDAYGHADASNEPAALEALALVNEALTWPPIVADEIGDVAQAAEAPNPIVECELQEVAAEEARGRARPVPDELVAWFAGRPAIADRFGLPRFEIRHRVVEVFHLSEDPDRPDDEPYVHKWGPIREFKTYAGAERRRDELVASTGRTVLLQHAALLWLTDEEAGRPTP